MRTRASFRRNPIVTIALALATAVACSSVNSLDVPPGTGALPGSGGSTTTIFDAGPTGSAGHDAGAGLNPLCGTECRAAGCFNCASPDDPFACVVEAGTRGSGGAAGAGGAGPGGALGSGGAGGRARDAGSSDAQRATPDAADASKPTEHDGGAPADASSDASGPAPKADGGRRFDGSATGAPGDGGSSSSDAGAVFSCQVMRASSGDPFHQCLPAGTGRSGYPCRSTSDCRPGLACAGLANAMLGSCLPYCCDSTTACDQAWVAGGGGAEDGSVRLYCGRRALVDASHGSADSGAQTAPQVPVCVLPDFCQLGDPFPCTGASCACRSGTACTVKLIPGDGGTAPRGTTSCEIPGKSRAGEHCDPSSGGNGGCAAGYFCSEATGLCLKFCEARGGDTACAPGKCQVAAGFPDGWGVCVGPTPAAK